MKYAGQEFAMAEYRLQDEVFQALCAAGLEEKHDHRDLADELFHWCQDRERCRIIVTDRDLLLLMADGEPVYDIELGGVCRR